MERQRRGRPASPAAGDRGRTVLVITVLALCGTIVSLQQTLVLPLLPEFPELLDTSVDNASWLVTATLLSGAVATPTLSRLADMFGKKRMMVVALAVTVLGSVLGALSTALPLIIAARALQGVGMALIPVGIAIMRDELPRERVPLGVALMSATLAVGAGVGLPLSGLITEHLDWHAIFWVTGLVGALLLLAAVVVLSESPVRTGGSFDLPGAVVLSAALTALLLSLSKAGQWGWTSAPTLLLSAAGAVLLAGWVPLELRRRNPLVDVRVAARPAVLLVNVVSVLTGFAMFANMLVTTQLLQLPATSGYGLGLDVLDTGLWMAPSAFTFAAMAPISAALIRRAGPQVTLLAGSLVMFGAYAGRAFFSQELWQIVTGSIVVAGGTAMTYAAMPTLIMRAVPVTETASANGLNVLLRSVGTSVSSAAMAAVSTMAVVRVGGEVFPAFGALMVVFWVAAAVSLASALLAVPMLRMGEYAGEAKAPEGHVRDTVVRGRVVSTSGRPVRNAVVSVLTPDGDPVDWGQVDPAGEFSVAVPRSGEYLVVTAAEGWTPQSRLARLGGGEELPPVVLPERLTLAGVVTDGTAPVPDALVAMTRQSGEVVATSRTGADGRYVMPLPPNGRYVLTVLSPTGTTAARGLTVWGTTRQADVEVPPQPSLGADDGNRTRTISLED